MNKDDPEAEKKFQVVQKAYEVILLNILSFSYFFCPEFMKDFFYYPSV